jgi:integrase
MARRKSKRPHGTGSKQTRGKGGRRTRLRWYDEHGRRHSKTVDAELADKALVIRLGRAAAGEAETKPDPALVPTLKTLAVTWLAERTNRSASDDRSRWKNHLEPEMGHLRPDEVTQAVLRRFIASKLARGKLHVRGKKTGKSTGEGLSPTTVGLCIKLLSVFFTDLVVRGEARMNPCKHEHLLPDTRRKIRSTHDPRTVPFLERAEDIRAVYLALPEPVNTAFAIGVFCGLRTSEIQALPWAHLDLARRRIHVQVQVPTKDNPTGRLKDNESRIVLIQADLVPTLAAWKLRAKGPRVIPPMRSNRSYLDVHTMGKEIRRVLDRLGLMVTPWDKPWYQATRHTFASQWMLGDGEIAKLKEQMGHCSVTVTERYAHLSPRLFRPEDERRIRVDLSPATGTVLEMPKAAAGGTKLGPSESGPSDGNDEK